MTERPILMHGRSVRAILAGTKTQTRRPVKGHIEERDGGWVLNGQSIDNPAVLGQCKFGVPGDRLWVRETWQTDSTMDEHAPSKFALWPVKYAADGAVEKCGSFFGNTEGRVRASIHMPRWASRLTLELTEVRVERVQAISDEDCVAEGYGHSFGPGMEHRAFDSAWDSMHHGTAFAWDRNPWVWVLTFSRVRP